MKGNKDFAILRVKRVGHAGENYKFLNAVSDYRPQIAKAEGKNFAAAAGKEGVGTPYVATDFFVAPNKKAVPAIYKEWLGVNQRNTLMAAVSDTNLRNAIDQLYRESSIIGDGGTASSILFEKETGIMLSKNGHMQKGYDMLGYLDNIIKNGNLSASDIQVLKNEYAKLLEALKR